MANNIFGGEDKKHNEEFQTKVDTHSKALVTVTQRQKDIEGSLQVLSEKVEMLDHNSVKDMKEIHNEISSLKKEVTDLQSDIKNIKDFNEKISKQLKMFTTKDEVTKLEKYIDLWEPLQFVTREELEKSKKETVEKLSQIIENILLNDDASQDKKK